MNRRVATLAMAAALLVPTRAYAHAHLKRSDPAAGARLTAPPQFIRLWFTEQPDVAMTFASLTDSTGTRFGLGNARREITGQMGIALRVLDALPPGRYTLSWRTAASDGHPSAGKFTFVIQQARAATSIPPPSPSTARSGTIGPLINGRSAETSGSADEMDAASSAGNSLARSFLFLGLMALVGATCFKVVVLRRANAVPAELKRRMARQAAVLGVSAASLVIIISLIRLRLESQMMSAMPEMPGMVRLTSLEMVTQTDWGLGFIVQLTTAVAALIGFTLAIRLVRGGWFLAVVSAVLLALTPALGGHAAASPRFTSLMIAADWFHVLGAAGWLGSLLSLMLIGVPMALILEPTERWVSVASLVNSFSNVALICAGIVVVSGIFASWIHLEHLTALWRTTYGKVLLVKLVFVAITLGIGGYNFKRVQPQLSTQMGTERLRRSAATELGTAFLILLVTGLLTGISP